MANVGSMLTPIEGNQTSRIYDISPEVLKVSQFVPLVHDLAYQNIRPTSDIRFQWENKDYQTTYTTINAGGGYSAGATNLVVSDASIFTVRDVVRNDRTYENYQVTVVNTGTNTITVLRNIGATGALAINNGDGLQILGPAMEGASSSPTENNANTTTTYNYVQTMRKSWSFAGNRLRTNSTPGMTWEDFVRDEMDEMLRRIEYTLVFGKRHVDTTNYTKYDYYTNGVFPQISTNLTSIGGTLSEDAWRNFLTDKAFLWGSQRKIFVCGVNLFKCFTKWGTDNLWRPAEMNVGAREGLYVNEWVSPTGGILVVYEHELFKNGALPGLGIVIDPAGLRLRYTDGSQTRPDNMLYKNGMLQFGENIQTPDTDGYKSEYFCEYGLELRNESWHAAITGVTGPA